MPNIDELNIVISASADNASKSLVNLTTKLNNIKKGVSDAGKKEGFSNLKSNTDKLTNSLLNANKETLNVSKKIKELSKRFANVGKDVKVPSTLSEVRKEIANTEKDLQRFSETEAEMIDTGSKLDSVGFIKLQRRISDSLNKLDVLLAKEKELINLDELAFNNIKIHGLESPKTSTEEPRTTTIKTSDIQYNADAMKAVFGDGYESIKNWNQAINQLGNQAGQVLNGISNSVGNVEKNIDNARIATENFSSEMGKIKKINLFERIKNFLSGFLKIFSSVPIFFSKIGNAISGISNNFKGLKKNSDVFFGAGLKTVLKYGLGIRSLYILFNRLRQAVVEGFNNLSQFSNETNKSLSNVKSSLTQVKNSLATAFSPIFTVIAPAITSFINMLSNALNMFGQFIAALTGKKTYVKSLAVSENYAEGLANSTGKAADNAKKIKSNLRSFDELKTINLNDDSSGGSGSVGSGGISPDEMFETVEITGKILELADKIKTAYENVKNVITEIYMTIKEKLQPIIQLFSEVILPDLKNGWERIQEVLTPLGEFIKKVFVSIWEDFLSPVLEYTADVIIPKLTEVFKNFWQNVLVPIGNLIADVLTPIISILADILTFLWKDVVVPLGNMIGNVLTAAFEGMCDIFNEFVIPAVENAIESFQFLWKNVISPVISFLRTVFLPVFQAVFSSINSIITNVTKVFRGLIDFIAGVFSANWSKAWKGIELAFSGVMGTLKAIARTPVNAIMALFEGLANGIIKAWNSVKKAINSLSLNIPSWVPGVGGKKIGFDLKMTSTISLPRFETGGFPEDGWFRASHGELLGKFDNGQTVVANNKQITDGISAAVYQGNRENNALLRQELQLMQAQNELLSRILEKETGISSSTLFNEMRKEANSYFRRTGQPAFI